MPKVVVLAAVAACAIGCSNEQNTPGAAASSSATAVTSSAPSPSAAAPAPSASAPGKPRDDCPAGSSGEGTLAKPCTANGTARLMEAIWNGKMTDADPSFKVTNKSKLVILYGRIAVYFYDKAGKQLEVKDAGGKPHPNQQCLGNLFSGVMNPGEKATMTFSCVKKQNVPDGTAFMEAEMQTVGFADASGKKSEFYWQNNDLAPDVRPKGGSK
jgi:hypothetical protein